MKITKIVRQRENTRFLYILRSIQHSRTEKRSYRKREHPNKTLDFSFKIVQIVSNFFEFKSYSRVLSFILSFSLLSWTTLYTLLAKSSNVVSVLLKLINDRISINVLCYDRLRKTIYIKTFHISETVKSVYLKPECK